MAQSRVERFKEYRKSIISDNSDALKSTIDVDIKVSSPRDGSPISEQEALSLKRIYQKETAINILYFACVLTIVITLVVFAFILF